MLLPPKSPLPGPNTPFTLNGMSIGLTVADYWQWEFGDLLLNKWRGRLAEYIVSRSLGIDEPTGDAWSHADLVMPSGVAVEVKSSAFLQSWGQSKLTAPSWSGLRSRRLAQFDDAKWRHDQTASAKGDVLVLALFSAQNHALANPLELTQWVFWPLAATDIETASISLPQVERRFRSHSFETLPIACRELEADILATRRQEG